MHFASRLELTLQDDPHYAERRDAVVRRKVEQCADTFRELIERNPVGSFRDQLQQDLDKLGRFEFLPWGLTDTAAQAIRALGGGQRLAKTIGAVEVDTILDDDFAPLASRMERWICELESSAVAAREEAIVIYREWDGGRALKAHHT